MKIKAVKVSICQFDFDLNGMSNFDFYWNEVDLHQFY